VFETYSSGTKRLGKETWHVASIVCASNTRTMCEHDICVACSGMGFRRRSTVDLSINRLRYWEVV
jgi:hypothetical protein